MDSNCAPDNLQVVQIIGTGAYGKVYHCKHAINKTDYAVKISQNIKRHRDYAVNESNIMLQLNSIDSTPKLYNIFETKHHYGIVLEILNGPTLYQYCLKYPHGLNEHRAGYLFWQIISALDAIHSCKIYHRDLKPDNIIIIPNIAHLPIVKIIDFGFSDKTTSTIIRQIGTPLYKSPEALLATPKDIFNGIVNDIWSLGIIFFEMLTQRVPFYGSDIAEYSNSLKTYILLGPHYKKYLQATWLDITVMDSTKELTACILNPDPITRISIKGIKQHPFFKQILWSIDWSDLTTKSFTLEHKPSILPNPLSLQRMYELIENNMQP